MKLAKGTACLAIVGLALLGSEPVLAKPERPAIPRVKAPADASIRSPQADAKPEAPAKSDEASAKNEPGAGPVLEAVSAAPGELVYSPPRRGSPRARRGGGVRSARIPGAGNSDAASAALVPRVQVLAPPDHVGLTSEDAPSLLWYIDGPVPEGMQILVTLADEQHIDPLLRTIVDRPAAAGIYRADLDAYGVRLEQDVEYLWSVTLVVDPKRPARNQVSIGDIARIQPAAGFEARAASLGELAHEGLWYDLLARLEDRLLADPDDDETRAARERLLRQVGLADAVPVGR